MTCHQMLGSWLPRMAGLVCLISVGCVPTAQFNLNTVYLTKQERDSRSDLATRREEIGNVLVAMFGTPDDPQVPDLGELNIKPLIDQDRLHASAGPVGRDETGRAVGLYREHCAHCHGVTGDGAGPTAAFLNPYPRDYRLGAFKFKSTPKGGKPTHEDLRLILMNGIPGTAMPSFLVLSENEIESLIHYVRYLSWRGEVERLLMGYAATELDAEKPMFDFAGAEADKAEQANVLKSFAVEVAQKWVDAESQAVEIPARPAELERSKSIARGRELFYGPIANCVKCHGDSALGDGQVTDYDDWTKEIEPQKPDALAAFLEAGALAPRNIRPRNLRQGIYRGGRRPIDLFWRIRNGIDGTPMPGASMKADDAGPEVKGLTTEDIWCLVDYVQSLPNESVSKPSMPESSLDRARL